MAARSQRSQNGWTVGTVQALGGLDTSAVPGTRVKLRRGLRRGDVATVLLHVAERFHRTVEPLRDGWCWGYDLRKVRDSSSVWSNHASGTAIDLNAPRHPRLKRGTFRAQQVAAIRRILEDCDGVVAWGGDFGRGRVDEMHFEISGNPAALAKRIRGGHTAALVPDGMLRAATIRRWQQVMGTPVDGRIDEPSDLVRAVQRHLNKHGAKLAVDGRGIYPDGRRTRTVEALQAYLRTPRTGRLGKPVVIALQKRLNSGRF